MLIHHVRRGAQRHPGPAYHLRAAVAATAVAGLAIGFAPGMAAAAAHPARPAITAPPSMTAYAYGNKPTSHSYRPEAAFSFNSTGQGITITRSGVGKYSVEFFGLGPVALQGTVDVSGQGENTADSCETTGWGPDSTGNNLVVGVDCFAPSGARANGLYNVAFTSGGSTTGTTDYVWANKPTAGSYTPDLAYQFNSSGGTNRIQHLAAGQYKVILPGPVVSGGTVKVTAYGTNSNFCQVVQWLAVSPGQNVFVDCFTAAGAPVNNRFTMTFTASDDLLGSGVDSGYLWGDQPTASNYTPDLTYQFDSVGTTATVDRFLTGSYIGQFPSASEGSTGTEQTTAYGSTPAHCIADGPGGTVGNTQTADVFCFDTSGNPLDVTYTMQWMVR